MFCKLQYGSEKKYSKQTLINILNVNLGRLYSLKQRKRPVFQMMPLVLGRCLTSRADINSVAWCGAATSGCSAEVFGRGYPETKQMK